jgi:hypothetical protein
VLCCRCTTFQIKSDSTNANLGRFETFEFGLFFIRKFESIAVNGELVFIKTCVQYPDEVTENLDTKWKAAIILQIVNWLIGIILIITLFVGACVRVPYPPHVYGLIGLGFVCICCVCEGLIFLVFDSILCTENPVLEFLGVEENYNTSCDLGNGSSVIILSLVGYFATGLICCCLGGRDGADTQDEDGAVVLATKLEVQPSQVEQDATNEEIEVNESADTGGEPVLGAEENVDAKDDVEDAKDVDRIPDKQIPVNDSIEVTDDDFLTGMAQKPADVKESF